MAVALTHAGHPAHQRSGVQSWSTGGALGPHHPKIKTVVLKKKKLILVFFFIYFLKLILTLHPVQNKAEPVTEEAGAQFQKLVFSPFFSKVGLTLKSSIAMLCLAVPGPIWPFMCAGSHAGLLDWVLHQQGWTSAMLHGTPADISVGIRQHLGLTHNSSLLLPSE